jgi:hypothetical protein
LKEFQTADIIDTEKIQGGYHGERMEESGRTQVLSDAEKRIASG